MSWRILLVALLLLSGCSTFKQSRRLDLAPFAEYTVRLASDIEFGMTSGAKVHYLMDYRKDPVVRAHAAKWDNVRSLVRSVVSYSVEITTLGNSSLSEKERNERFALFLDRLARPVIEENPDKIHITHAKLDTILYDVRHQPTFLAALGSAQPLIDESARIAEIIFDDLQDSLSETADYLVHQIEEENRNVIQVRKNLIASQERMVRSIQLLMQYRSGNTAVLPELLENEPQLRQYLSTDREPTFEEVQAAEDRLAYMMAKVVDFKEQFAPDMAYYRNQMLELDEIYKLALSHIKRARITIMVWERSHRNLAEGVTDPARIDLFDIAKKAVNTAI